MPDDRLPPATEATAYFTVAEALTNVAKYAEASHATVRMEREDGILAVEVSDDGKGGARCHGGLGPVRPRRPGRRGDGTPTIMSPPATGRSCAPSYPLAR